MESEVQTYVRENPGRAIAAGIGAGLLLAQLPVRLMVSAVLGLFLRLLKPALVVYGLFRLAEDCHEGRCPWKAVSGR